MIPFRGGFSIIFGARVRNQDFRSFSIFGAGVRNQFPEEDSNSFDWRVVACIKLDKKRKDQDALGCYDQYLSLARLAVNFFTRKVFIQCEGGETS